MKTSGPAKTWKLQDAKNKLSEVVACAERGAPQVITRRGEATAVVLGYPEWRRLTAHRNTLWEFLASSPLSGVALDVSRNRDPGRRVNL